MSVVPWHVLQAAPQCEPQVCKYLAVQGVEGYTPQFAPPPRTKPGSLRDRKHRWVFPGYVFFRVPQGFIRWEVVRWAPGVRKVLESDGSPAVIDALVIEHLQRRLAERTLSPAQRRFRRGEQVVIQSGPLRMVDAMFEREVDGAARVQILVHLLGRQVTVEVDLSTLGSAS